MLVSIYKNHFQERLKDEYPPEEVQSFFYLLTENFLGMSRLDLALDNKKILSVTEERKFEDALARLLNHEPIQYIIGETEFLGSKFFVNKHVLIPRPETEELVQWIIDDLIQSQVGEPSILDIGTGSGCIAVSLAKKFPKAKVTAMDISEEALEVAKANAKKNNSRVEFVHQDILSSGISKGFDIIVSNPPYVRELEMEEMQRNVLENEPAVALYVKDEDPLLFYRRITMLAAPALEKSGKLYFEINQYLSKETEQILAENDFRKEIRKDIFGNYRMLKGEKKINRKKLEEHQNKLESVAVFCASSDGLDTDIFKTAYRVGAYFAEMGVEVIYGGSRLGLMGQVAKGVLENNGLVTGVIPDFLKTKEVVHTGLTKLITTLDMHERKMKMHELSDGFIALPGGFGTLEELFEILTWGQLGLHRKPIGILNVNGYFDDLIEMMKSMVRKGLLKKENLDLVLIAETIEELYEKMKFFKPVPVPKWMNKDQT